MKNNEYDLPVWEHPADYGGFSPDGDFYIYAQHRDSDALERSNYECIFKALTELSESLETENDEPFVYDFRAGHWAVGWVEHMLIRKNAPDELQKLAYEILGALADYPVFDESHYSELEWNEASDYWQSLSIAERVEMCKDNNINIFEARHDYMPQSDSGSLFESLTCC